MRLSRGLGIVVLASLVLHMALLIFVPGDGHWVEAIFARGIYPAIGPAIAFLPGLLPFSVAGVGIVLIVLWIPAYLSLNLLRWRRGRFPLWRAAEKTLLAWVVVGTGLFHAFYLCWGYNYLRPPLERRLALPEADGSVERRQETARLMVERTVAAMTPIAEWDRKELNALIDRALARSVRELEGRAVPVVSPLKGDLNTGYLAFAGNGGVFTPQTLEPHVDFELPAFLLPFTAAHEKAHQAGFARERDANFVAWHALAHADDARLRFAGYFGVVSYFRYYSTAETQELMQPLLPYFTLSNAYRAGKTPPAMARTNRRVNNAYLKINRMEDGIADYAQVSDLIHAWIQVND